VRVRADTWRTRFGGAGRRPARLGAFLAALVAGAALLPAGAPAGQSSQTTATPVPQITAGVYHTCAVLPDRAVRCWGFSGDGQVGYGNRLTIGDDETPAAAGPVDVGANGKVIALAAGDYHSCAVLDGGTVRCWGYGNEGQLGYATRNMVGDDETPAAAGPVNVGAGRTATAITAGGNHTCAILDTGSVRCWGLSEFGQLGYANTTSIGDNETPGSVGPVDLGGHTATAVTAGISHTCAILDDAAVRCWGLGSNGQLGYANTGAVLDPGQVGAVNLGAGRTAKAITAGAYHTCAILDNGSVRCWGSNDDGQLGYANTTVIGDNEAPGSAGPVELGLGRTAISISAGGNHTCAVLDDGRVRCWGSGVFGQLGYGNLANVGDNETPGSVAPVDLGSGRTATAVVAGIYDTCARLADGAVLCWGNGADGRLGQCRAADIGDDEAPGSLAPVDIGLGGAVCPPSPAPPPLPPPPPADAAVVAPPPPPAATPDTDAQALRQERVRAASLRSCRADVLRQARTARTRALRSYGAGSRARTLALRTIAKGLTRGRVRCLSRFGRTPGRVTTIAAKPSSSTTIVLSFRAPGSDGSNPPAARSYVVKQSLRPIRSARDFDRAPTLCGGACTFAVTPIAAAITLKVTDLRRTTTYYYAVAARDNVSKRVGLRSRTVSAKTK